MTVTSAFKRQDPAQEVRLERLEAQIVELASQLTAAGARLTRLIGQFDAAEGWRRWGMRSTAHWLSWKCGMGLGAAREQVRVARALRDLPAMSAGYCAGRLSYSKVRALTRIASPATETELVNMAESATAAQIETLVARDRRAVRAHDARVRRESEFLRCHVDVDGSVVGSFRLSPERGLTVLHALDAAAGRVPDPIGEGDGFEGEAERRSRRTPVDGLVAICQTALTDVSAETSPANAERFQLVIHAPVEALTRRDNDDDEGAAVELHAPGGLTARIGPGTTLRLTCDCPRSIMIDGVDGSAVHVGRKTRQIKGRLRRAVNARDRGMCRAPGCTERATEIHHLRHWAQGGSTCLGNLISLCDQHHWLVHEGGFTLVVRSPGRWALFGPDGVTVESEPPVHLAEAQLTFGDKVAPDAITGHWDGSRLSHVDALAWLSSVRDREAEPAEESQPPAAESVSAETSPAHRAPTAPEPGFTFDLATIQRWYKTVDRLTAVSNDPLTRAINTDE